MSVSDFYVVNSVASVSVFVVAAENLAFNVDNLSTKVEYIFKCIVHFINVLEVGFQFECFAPLLDFGVGVLVHDSPRQKRVTVCDDLLCAFQ